MSSFLSSLHKVVYVIHKVGKKKNITDDITRFTALYQIKSVKCTFNQHTVLHQT